MSVSKSKALAAASAYASSRQRFQAEALRYVVEQSLFGNSDAIMLVFKAAGMLLPTDRVTADGRAAYRWLAADPADGGCGLSFLRWDKDLSRFKLAKGWKAKADQIDMAQVEHNLSAVLWYTWERTTERAERAFDLNARILRLVKDAKASGMTNAQIEQQIHDSVRQVIAASAVTL